jgi:hypothetical protein
MTSPSEPAAYLVTGTRTPFGRYGGALAAVRPDDNRCQATAMVMLTV